MEEVIGRKLTDLFGTTPDSLDTLFKNIIENDYKIVDGVGVEILPNGKNRYFLNNGHGIIEEDRLIRIWGTFRDITDKKIAEDKIKESEQNYRKAFNLAEFYKDLFAHDISNILQNVLSSIELSNIYLNDPDNQEKIQEVYQLINEQVKRGANLIMNVRKLSNIEENNLFMEPIDILAILQKNIDFVKASFLNKKINININCNSDDIIVIATKFLTDAFRNILFNAVNHNDNEEKIEIFINIFSQNKENKEYLRIEFIDNGSGVIDARKLEIFEREIDRDEAIIGIGLGLSLVKRIINNINGEIWVEDKIEGDHTKGSKFILLIPK